MCNGLKYGVLFWFFEMFKYVVINKIIVNI